MCDRINPPYTPIDPCDYANCERCCRLAFKDFLQRIWTSIFDEECQLWCLTCTNEHATNHPLFKDEQWAIGSTDTENNLTIK